MMQYFLESIELQHFRLFTQEKFVFHPQSNLFIGSNGVGKTSLMDAISFILSATSIQKILQKYYIQTSSPFFHLKGSVYHKDLLYDIDVHLDKKKHYLLNGKHISRYEDILNLFPLVSFQQIDQEIILGSPEYRRNFLNRHISYIHRPYYNLLIQMEHLLKNRNLALQNRDTHLLKVYQQKFLDTYWDIIDYRRKSIQEIQTYFRQLLPPSHPWQEVEISYPAASSQEELFQKAKSLQTLELQRRYSLLGAHRDNFDWNWKNQSIKYQFSQGEIKYFVLYLKLAQLEILESHLSVPPVLLLDDIFSTLDETSYTLLLEKLDKYPGQKFLSMVSSNKLERASFGKIIHLDKK